MVLSSEENLLFMPVHTFMCSMQYIYMYILQLTVVYERFPTIHTHRVWSIVCGSGDEVTSIPHPCYVYATCFIPPSPILTPNPQPSTHTSHYVIFTGTYDKIVRVWTLTPSRIQVRVHCIMHSVA